MKFSVVLICILQLIVVRSQSDSVEETTPEITIMEETTPEITTMEETTPEITIMEETTPEIITMGETTPEITIRGETTPGDETENTMISTMDTSTTTQKPDDSKHKRGESVFLLESNSAECYSLNYFIDNTMVNINSPIIHNSSNNNNNSDNNNNGLINNKGEKVRKSVITRIMKKTARLNKQMFRWK
ncbi:unnamed protein product [Trichobilharzia regenti]|nr:unnamed protein product [Trichobilharzia regenti]